MNIGIRGLLNGNCFSASVRNQNIIYYMRAVFCGMLFQNATVRAVQTVQYIASLFPFKLLRQCQDIFREFIVKVTVIDIYAYTLFKILNLIRIFEDAIN